MAQENGKTVRDHKYHAEGIAVEGLLVLPHPAKIDPQAHSQILTTSKSKEQPPRFYESEQAEPFRIEEIISYGRARSQAAGHQDTTEKGSMFKTLATSVVEDLNILNVVTCDRVVAQISTTHPRYEDEGHVPSVVFLGTTFINLRIGGFPVEVDLDLGLINPEDHSHKTAYTKNDAFSKRVAARLGIFRDKGSKVSADLKDYYAQRPARDGKECTQYTLVTAVEGEFPGTAYGNVLDIPNFGKVHLGVVRIKHSDYETDIPKTTLIELTMIDVRMGCLANGQVSCAVAKSNGGTVPPTP